MDDADGIIIPILRNIGCDIAEDIKSAAQFEAALLVHALAKCLHTIDEQKYDKIGDKLPLSIAKKVQTGTFISDALTDLNYRGEIGYDKIIYPNEKDTRSLLRFMVQKLSKHTAKTRKNTLTGDADDEEDDMESGQALDNRIHSNLKQWIKTKYSFLSKPAQVHQFRTIPLDYPQQSADNVSISANRVKYCGSGSLNYLPSQNRQYSQFIPSILSLNHKQYLIEQSATYSVDNPDDAELLNEIFDGKPLSDISHILSQCVANELDAARKEIKNNAHKQVTSMNLSKSNLNLGNTAFVLQKNYTQQEAVTAQAVDDSGKLVKIDASGQCVDSDDEKAEEARKKEIDKMKAAVLKLQERLKKMDAEIEKQEESFVEKEKEMQEEKERYRELERVCMTKKKTIDLIPNAQENLKKLAKIVTHSQQRYSALKQEWEEKKLLLMERFESRKNAMEGRKTRANDLLAEIRNMRREMRSCANEIREKEQAVNKMVAKLNKLPKTIDRQVYVDRILGVVLNLENQNNQIKQILDDVQELQRDTNVVIDKSKRIFGVVDNLVFTTASNEKDITAKRQLNQVYRQVVSMREYFDNAVDTARNISNAQNEIRDLEYQIVAAKEKVEALEMKKIKNDLKEVESENEELAKRLKLLKKQLKKSQRDRAMIT